MISYATSAIRPCRFRAVAPAPRSGANPRAVAAGLRCGLLLITVLVGLLAAGARAQTASFSYAIATLGGGFNLTGHVAVDGSDNVYVTDTNNSAIKEIPAGCTSASCVVTLGGGFNHPSGVALDASGNVYVADTYNNAIKEMPVGCVSSSCVTQLAPDAYFNGPFGVAVDGSGNVYVAATYGGQVREIPAGCNSVSCMTILGGGFGTPTDVVVDSSGNVYVSDNSNSAVLEIPPGCASSSCVITLGGGFAYPYGVAVDGSGNVYVADTSHIAIKEMPAGCLSSSCVTTLGGGFWFPQGVAVDGSGNVYVGDSGNNLVKEIMNHSVNFFTDPVGSASATTTLTFTFDSAGSLNATTPYQVLTEGATGLDFNAATTQESNACNGSTAYAAGDTCTVDVSFTPSAPGIRLGAVSLMDGNNNAIAIGYANGVGAAPEVAFPGAAPSTYVSGLSIPLGMTIDAAGDVIIANSDGPNVWFVKPGGATSMVGSGFVNPTSVASDGAGNIYVVDSGNVYEVAQSTGIQTKLTIPNLNAPEDIVVDGAGNLYISEPTASKVLKVTPAGVQTTVGSNLNSPRGMAIDASGDLFIADYSAGSVFEVTPAGVETGVGGFGGPTGVAVDAAGNEYVAVFGTGEVIEVTPNGTRTTLASGLPDPSDIALDGSGNIYFTEYISGQVQKIDRVDAPSLYFAATELGSTSSDSPRTVTVQNIGNAVLSFPVPGSGNNPTIPANFTFNSNAESACPLVTSSSTAGTLAAGTSCLLPISFTPATAGSFHGALTITDNDLNAVAPNYATQSIALNGTGTDKLFGHLDSASDSVTASTMVAQSDSVVVRGWAADQTDGTPLSNVTVYIDGNPVGAATVGIARPDVAATEGAGYLNAGYQLSYSASGLALGSHSVTVIALDSGGHPKTFGPLTFTVAAVAGAPAAFGHIDSALDSLTGSTIVGQSDSVVIKGWAADKTDGAPLSNVTVYIDGNSVGVPTLGIARPDVAAADGASYLKSGYELTYSAAGLALGSHSVTVIAVDSLGLSKTFGPLLFTVAAASGPALPIGNLESAVDSVTKSSTVAQSDSVLVKGWVADQMDGAPLSNVTVYIDGNSVGKPILGIARADVAAVEGAAYLNSGYQLSYSAAALAVGSHSVTVTAIDSGGRSKTFGPLVFTVE